MSKALAAEKVSGFASRLLDRLPGREYAQEQIERVERRVLTQLKQRLDQLESRAGQSVSVSVLAVQQNQFASSGSADLIHESPARLLMNLLEMSNQQDRARAQQGFFALVLGSLLPDEARVLAAMADGTPHPVLDLMVGSKIGLATQPALELISSVGRDAGVQLNELTPVYLRRLMNWGLVERQIQEASELRTKYEILETDSALRATIARYTAAGMRTRVVRSQIRGTAIAQTLWESAQLSEMPTF